jgi:perosamine synthetase
VRKNIAIIGYPVCGRDVARALKGAFDPWVIARFLVEISRLTQSKTVFAANSGNACFYVILKALHKSAPEKTEVVLPAYTAPSLVVTIRKAGLKPVLCDISLDDFNADLPGMLGAVTKRTLAVLGVHMFGIPWLPIKDVKKALGSEVALIEDAAQAMGAKINGVSVGFFGDVSFFSFNRGKNLPALTGGIAAAPNSALAAELRAQAEALLACGRCLKSFAQNLKCAALWIAFNPFWYGLLRFLIVRFKDTSVPGDIAIERFSRFQAAFGLSLLDRFEESVAARYRNGIFYHRSLSVFKDLVLPALREGVMPAFNRMPVIFKKSGQAKEVRRQLKEAGIESSRMYDRPLHHIFDLGYRRDDFPNAVFLADNLLTLPVHPLVRQEDLDLIVETIRKTITED